jgi:hypothetical protein
MVPQLAEQCIALGVSLYRRKSFCRPKYLQGWKILPAFGTLFWANRRIPDLL